MKKYTKNTPRLTVKFINSDTEEELISINDRTWMNVGEIFSDHIVSTIIDQEFKGKEITNNIMVLVVGEYSSQ